MLTYNTQLKELILPEYGRTIQQMVDYCLIIEDHDERTRCAHAIIKTMRTLFPDQKSDEATRKFWDHLALMSGYKLDIDWPVDIVRPENIEPHPDPVVRDETPILALHYGKNLERMI